MIGASPNAPAAVGREADARDACLVRRCLAEGREGEARDHFAEIVRRHQRRASRIALHYMRDPAEADEAVQDAFVKAYVHLDTFREELPFEVWFTRILVNGCLDRIKARARRERWLLPKTESHEEGQGPLDLTPAPGPSPEEVLLARERRRQLAWALDQLPARQRLVFAMSQIEGCSSKEVGAATGLNESTVRVHLFRAIRKLRKLLSEDQDRHQEIRGRAVR